MTSARLVCGVILVTGCAFVGGCSSDDRTLAGSVDPADAGTTTRDGSPAVDAADAGGVIDADAGPSPDPFGVVADHRAVDIFVDSADDPAVIRAAGDLEADVERVSGVSPVLKNSVTGLSSHAILIGTLGKSPVLDALVAQHKLDVTGVEGRWESFVVQVVNEPVKGVERALVIAGSDRRGAIFGVYDVSESIGVSPWYWWADVAPEHHEAVSVPGDTRRHGEPSFKYRGIFMNDEENFAAWSTKLDPGKKPGPEVYKKVFELLLRLKANFLWPAMHPVSDCFNKYPENAKNAELYGIVMGSSHPEMLLRNNVKEWDPWAKSHLVDGAAPAYDYSVNPTIVRDYWDARVEQNGSFENVYSVGMRGIHDSPMVSAKATTTEAKVALLQTIFTDQRKILAKRALPANTPAPQIFTPYKEVLDLYNAGLEVPDDVTLLWPEDNHGYVRQIPSDTERARAGGSGVYYHLSYWGPPGQSYLWLNTTPLTLVREELRKVLDVGAHQVFVLNVGDIKPAEIGIEFAMRFAYHADDFGDGSAPAFVTQLAARDFSATYAKDISDIVMRYFQINIARRPEFMKKGVYSLVNYGDEAERRSNELADLVARAETISGKLPADRVDAFYEMVLYPLRASKLTLEKYVDADRTDLCAAQGRRKSVAKYRAAATAAHDAILSDLAYYNTKLASGKWDKIINPFNTQMPTIEALPVLAAAPAAATGTALGVVVEGQSKEESTAALHFSAYAEDERFIDVFTKTDAGFTWSAALSQPWIKLSTSSGTIADEQRIRVTIDWSAVPNGDSTGTIEITSPSASKTIDVHVSKPASPTKISLDGYVEANGYVAIEAEHFSEAAKRGGAEWRVLEGLGRSGDSVKVFPDASPSVTSQLSTHSPSLDYKVYFFSTGSFPVTIYRLPTLDTVRACRLAIGIDDDAPQIVSGIHSVNDAGWRTALLEHIEKLTAKIQVTTPGYHTIHLFKVDPSILVDRIVIDTGGLAPSYLGPPESYRH